MVIAGSSGRVRTYGIPLNRRTLYLLSYKAIVNNLTIKKDRAWYASLRGVPGSLVAGARFELATFSL